MPQIVWKPFNLGSLFSFDSNGQLSLNEKALDLSPVYDFVHTVALVTQSEKNNGVKGYLCENDEVSSKKKKNCLSYSMHFGLCFYHDYDFALMDTHGSVFILNPKGEYLSTILKNNKSVNLFLARLITYVCSNDIYNYSWLPNSSRAAREIILLPCIEVDENEEYIWNEQGKHYTLAIDYINNLMISARKLREKNTIEQYKAQREKYESEREKYESEREKYENANLAEKKNVVWLPHTLGSIFTRSTKLAFNKNQKDLNLSDEADFEHSIALVSASREGKGIVGYLENSQVNQEIVSKNKITFDDQWGYTAYQDEDFVITGGHNAILEINNSKLKQLADSNNLLLPFMCKLINKITFETGIFGYNYKINNKFDREIILLPCIEVGENEEYIWNERGKYYTLAVDYINYIYLTGEIKYYDNMIKKYDYGN